jgi:hypothetical protein
MEEEKIFEMLLREISTPRFEEEVKKSGLKARQRPKKLRKSGRGGELSGGCHQS